MKTIGKVLILVFAALTMTACRGPVVVIQPGEIGVVFNVLTGELKDPIGPGMYILPPVIEEVTIYSTQQQICILSGSAGEVEPGSEAVLARTSDGQGIYLDVTVIYTIDPAKVTMIHARWQNQYVDNFVRPMVRSVVHEIPKDYNALDIFYAEDRADFEDAIRLELETQFAKEGLILDSFLLRDIVFAEEYSAAIESGLIATRTAIAPTQVTITPTP